MSGRDAPGYGLARIAVGQTFYGCLPRVGSRCVALDPALG